MAFADEKKARQIGESRAQEALVAQRGEKSKLSLEDLFQQIQEGDVKEINLIVKQTYKVLLKRWQHHFVKLMLKA